LGYDKIKIMQENFSQEANEQSRQENMEKWESLADVINQDRPFWQKVIGRNKIKPLDIAHEEALVMNQQLDEIVKTGRARNYEEAQRVLDADIEESEIKQLEFEEMTRKNFEAFSRLSKDRDSRIDLKKEGLVTEDNYYMRRFMDNKEDDYFHAEEVALTFLCGIKNGEFPDNFAVLEVGGGDNSLKHAFMGRAHYTDIDKVDNITYEGLSHHYPIEMGLGMTKDGKLSEALRMDVLRAPETLKGRVYDFVLSNGVFGFPTTFEAERRGEDPSEYEKEILRAMKSLLRDGGFILISSRERWHFGIEDLKNLGFDYLIRRFSDFDYPCLLLRKIPVREMEEKLNESQEV